MKKKSSSFLYFYLLLYRYIAPSKAVIPLITSKSGVLLLGCTGLLVLFFAGVGSLAGVVL